VRRERWGPRTIDLDLLFALDEHGAPIRLATDRLTLPHPGLRDRDFARRPLLDVAPDLAPHLDR
jgi:2-amino-4-hydroxy-6-hydroxymethyldihydropteridine diphosphokinase